MTRDRLELRKIIVVLSIGVELIVIMSRHNLCISPFMY